MHNRHEAIGVSLLLCHEPMVTVGYTLVGTGISCSRFIPYAPPNRVGEGHGVMNPFRRH